MAMASVSIPATAAISPFDITWAKPSSTLLVAPQAAIAVTVMPVQVAEVGQIRNRAQ